MSIGQIIESVREEIKKRSELEIPEEKLFTKEERKALVDMILSASNEDLFSLSQGLVEQRNHYHPQIIGSFEGFHKYLQFNRKIRFVEEETLKRGIALTASLYADEIEILKNVILHGSEADYKIALERDKKSARKLIKKYFDLNSLPVNPSTLDLLSRWPELSYAEIVKLYVSGYDKLITKVKMDKTVAFKLSNYAQNLLFVYVNLKEWKTQK